MRTPPLTDPNRLLLFTVYAFLIGLLASLTPEVLKEFFAGPDAGTRWYPGIWRLAILGLVVALFLIYSPAVKRWLAASSALAPLTLTSDYKVRFAKGLVLLVSRGEGVHSGICAIDYHRPELTHVWLLHSSDPGSIEGREKIERHCSEVAPAVKVEARLIHNIFSIEGVKALVESIRREAKGKGICDADFICDFTGMNKPVSAGVVLACIRPENRLQYMEPTQFLADGKPDSRVPSHPVEVLLSYDADLV